MKIRRLLFGIILPLLFASGTAYAQDRRITGKVTDSTGAPVVNASVVVKGGRNGTQTSSDGTFALSVAPNATTLVVSSVNFETQEVPIGNGIINVTLEPNSSALTNVTV